MSIERLISVAPPPARPKEAFDGPWHPIELEFGRYLPQDYKDLVKIYGFGLFFDFLKIFVPNAPENWARIERANLSIRNVVYHILQPHERPYPVWPDPGGLIQLGYTDNGDTIFWLPLGPPDKWKIVIWDRGDPEDFETFDCSLTDFLADVATGAVQPRAFPDDLLPCNEMFEPKTPVDYPD
jgi:hypothetical protein